MNIYLQTDKSMKVRTQFETNGLFKKTPVQILSLILTSVIKVMAFQLQLQWLYNNTKNRSMDIVVSFMSLLAKWTAVCLLLTYDFFSVIFDFSYSYS